MNIELISPERESSVLKFKGFRKPHIKTIIKYVSILRDVTPQEIIGPRRFKSIVKARDEVISRARFYGYSLNDIARELGGRDHTTIHYSLNKTGAKVGEEYK